MDEKVAQLEPRFKELLYRCLEQIRATKAALYLGDESEGFELSTQYGFRDTSRKHLTQSDEVVNRLLTQKRQAFFVNGLSVEPKFSELFFQSDTSRLLAAPIYSRGKMVGFLDLRDKPGGESFTLADAASLQKIAEQFLDLFAEYELFGQMKISIAGVKGTDGPIVLEFQSPATTIVIEAKRAIERGILRPQPYATTLTEQQNAAAALVLPGILSLPGVVLTAFSSFGRLGGVQTIAARSEILPETLRLYEQKLRAWLQKRGEEEHGARTQLVYPFGTAGPPVEPSRIVSLLSAPVVVRNIRGLVLTVAFDSPADARMRTALSDFLDQVKQIVEYALAFSDLRQTNLRIAEKLIEPDLQHYPALLGHSRRVAELAERLATYVGLPREEVEKIRLAAMVHDVGMRMLDYRNLYRKAQLTAEELAILREHVTVGAALVAESPLGSEIATIVFSHHERPDGTGYPRGISGEDIPVASRIIHICETYDAMTAQDSYQPPGPAGAALAQISRMAGAQFDVDLAARFCEMMGSQS